MCPIIKNYDEGFLKLPESYQTDGSAWLDPEPKYPEDYIDPQDYRPALFLSTKRALLNFSGETSAFWLEHLPEMQTLEDLSIGGNSLSQELVDLLGQLPRLKKLVLYKVIAGRFDSFSELKNLTHLSLAYTKSSADLAPILANENLEALQLAMPQNMGCIDYSSLSNLKYLMLASCAESREVKLQDLENVSVLSELEYLMITNVKVENRSLEFLKDMKNLKYVTVEKPNRWSIGS